MLRLMAKGWDNGRIAGSLYTAEGTVKNDFSTIYAKLNVSSRAEAMASAWQQGLIEGAG